MKNMKIYAFIVAVFFFSSIVYASTAYHVDYTAGSDTNAGTVAAPWKNVDKADTAAVVAVGDSIFFKSGVTWDNSQTAFTFNPRTGVYYGKYGTGALPIMTKAGNVVSTTSKTGIVIRDLSFINTGTGGVMSFNGNCDSIQVLNCTFTGPSYGIYWTSGVQVDHFTADGLTITCTTAANGLYFMTGRATGTSDTLSITNTTINSGGIYIKNGSAVTIANCRFNGPPQTTSAGVQIDSCLATVTITDVDVYNALGPSFYFRRSPVITSLTATRCNSHNSAEHGFILDTFPRASFVDCVVDTTTGTQKHGFYLYNSSNAATFLRCTAKNSTGTGCMGFYIVNTDSVNAYDCTVRNMTGEGVYLEGTSDTHLWQNILVRKVTGDAFSTRNDVHDVTFFRCWGDSCGNKATTDNGDAFTCHNRNYNINIISSLGTNGTCSGVAMVDSSSGSITNCTFENNAGDWSAEGGGKLNQVRGGCYINTIAKNPTSGTSWVVKNCIFKNNYPVEVYLNAKSKDLVTMDYNCYLERTTGEFATLNSLSTKINWAAYASREAHSEHVDPYFIDPSIGNYRLRSMVTGHTVTSSCIGSGDQSALAATVRDYYNRLPVVNRGKGAIEMVTTQPAGGDLTDFMLIQ